MKFLLTGASGFLGTKLIERFKTEHHEVLLLGLSPAADQAAADFITADITDQKQLAAIAKDIGQLDAVIHLAAAVPKKADEDTATVMDTVNVGGTINLLEAFGGQTRNFVYASTAEVYGLPDTKDKLDETTLPVPLTNYGASKLAGELFVKVYAHKHQLPASILRFSVLYGPGDTINRAIPNFIKQALAGQPLQIIGGEELRDYVHVEDAVEALFLAATKAPDGLFNIGTGQGIKVRDAAQKISALINPALAFNVQPAAKKAADIVFDTTKAEQILGFKPKYIFPQKLEEQIAWHKSH